MSIKVAIVYHSGYGHTAAVAEHVAKGAAEAAGAEATLYKVEEFGANEGPWDQLRRRGCDNIRRADLHGLGLGAV